MTAPGGLLIGGQIHHIQGLTVWNPQNAPGWCKLSPRDYRPRRTPWVRQVILHTTKGIWPQKVKPGKGPTDREQLVARYWQKDPVQSAAHIVIGSDGEVACLCDLALICSYHATLSNDWSVGIELYQEADGTVYEAAYESALVLVPELCELFEFPLQVPSRVYPRAPIARMDEDGKTPGGPDMVGVFGHRDNTHRRGRGDPGDEVFRRLRERCGADAWDYDAREDLDRGSLVQGFLNEEHGADLKVDGLVGPKTYRAMKAHGFTRLSQVPV